MRASSSSTEWRRLGTAAPPAAALERLVHLLDEALPVPGTRWRIGLDGVVGFLFPGGGDVLGAVLAATVVALAVRQGLPGLVVARMVANVAVDLVLGAVPLVGDLFDVAWKANVRNLRLLRAHAGRRQADWRDWLWLAGLLAALGLAAAGVVALVVLGLRAAGLRLPSPGAGAAAGRVLGLL